MVHGKSVKLFLVDSTPNGILTAEIINWTGHVLSAPRSKLAELIQREECARTGVYFLIGYDPENPLYPKVYIGESDDVGNRLKQHNRTEESGGKDFWERVCLVTNKDQNLTKAHIKYLECRLMDLAKQNGQCLLENSTSHMYKRLPESDIADMEFFLDQLKIVLPVLGFDFLKDLKRPSYQEQTNDLAEVFPSKIATFSISSRELDAKAQEIDGEFYVLKGSQVKQFSNSTFNYTKLRDALIEKKVIDPVNFTFSQDYMFNSPSAASGVIQGRSSNGRKEWRELETGLTYAEWQQKQVDSV